VVRGGAYVTCAATCFSKKGCRPSITRTWGVRGGGSRVQVECEHVLLEEGEGASSVAMRAHASPKPGFCDGGAAWRCGNE
jgi:hypothetical protein